MDPPCTGLVRGEYQIMLPEAMAFEGSTVHRPGWLTQEEVFDPDRDGTELVQHYVQCIKAEMTRCTPLALLCCSGRRYKRKHC